KLQWERNSCHPCRGSSLLGGMPRVFTHAAGLCRPTGFARGLRVLVRNADPLQREATFLMKRVPPGRGNRVDRGTNSVPCQACGNAGADSIYSRAWNTMTARPSPTLPEPMGW